MAGLNYREFTLWLVHGDGRYGDELGSFLYRDVVAILPQVPSEAPPILVLAEIKDDFGLPNTLQSVVALALSLPQLVCGTMMRAGTGGLRELLIDVARGELGREATEHPTRLLRTRRS